MIWVDTKNRIPIKSWCKSVEDGAIEQAHNLANHPAIVRHVALMPDCHQGYGMPIGGVIATRDVIIPNAVGVDIGCGMCAVKTTADEIDTDTVKRIMGEIREAVPVGFNHHQLPQEWKGFGDPPLVDVIQREIKRARHQMGTLGGGNHFIEIQRADDGRIWLMLHSGSRNFGLKIAKEYHGHAQRLCEKWHSSLPDKDLAFLPLDSERGQEYVAAMNYALSFAEANRAAMMDRAMDAAANHLKCDFSAPVNIHHNYARLEHHFGENLWIHRKGATSARKGEGGIIPGSMGTPSYITRGLGNPDSFQSCSHGAGRVMGRMQASRSLTVEEADSAMEGIVYGRWGTDRKGRVDLGEAPQAYKDIDEVMASQADLTDPIVRLCPLGVIKG